MIDETEIPSWRWRELFIDGSIKNELGGMRLRITKQGIRRIA